MSGTAHPPSLPSPPSRSRVLTRRAASIVLAGMAGMLLAGAANSLWRGVAPSTAGATISGQLGPASPPTPPPGTPTPTP
ncbi:MAG: hypothetical protein JWM18_2613 [Chloroflexi bacterium]|jgi:hypothetical protein|nr:hypothetical protein [Chloroflexota bacterium]